MEGALKAPARHPIDYSDLTFHDAEALDVELRRVFDICHGCRRCFNLCDSFPRLFDLVDESDTGELDSVDSADFKPVIDACTLCDMCFVATCPYVPPHEFALDFPHLILRARSTELAAGRLGWADKALAKTDRNGKLVRPVAFVANWASDRRNRLTRPVMQAVAGIHRDASLPRYQSKTFTMRARRVPAVNAEAPAAGRKVAIFATCFVNYNNPEIGEAARAVADGHEGSDLDWVVCYQSRVGPQRWIGPDIATELHRAAADGVQAGVAHHSLDGGFADVAHAAVELLAGVHHLVDHFGAECLDHRDVLDAVVAQAVAPGGVVEHVATGRQFGAGFDQGVAHRLVGANGLAELEPMSNAWRPEWESFRGPPMCS